MSLVTDDPRWNDSLTVEPWDRFAGRAEPGSIVSLADRPDRSAFPDRLIHSDGGGYIYCLALPGDVYKVGLTVDPANRVAQHITAARSYGVSILCAWISPAHKEFRQTEAGLIEHLSAVAERLGPESFRRAGLFDDVRMWWDLQEVHPPGEFAHEQRARLGI